MRELNLEGGGSVFVINSKGGGVELNDQLLDPDSPTLASQVKLKVSPKGLPFVMNQATSQQHLSDSHLKNLTTDTTT